MKILYSILVLKQVVGDDFLQTKEAEGRGI